MMQTHLYLYLHDAQRLEWLLVNHGERLGTESGSWSDLEAHLSNEGVVQPLTTVILAGYQSSYVKTDLTAQQQKFAASAVAYAIEEKLSLDPTECHVVMDGKPSSSSMTAWVVAKTLMHHIQREADGLRLRVRHCYVDTDIAVGEAECQFIVTEHGGLLCRAHGIRVSGTTDWTAILCERIDKDVRAQAFFPNDFDGKGVFDAQMANHFSQTETSESYQQPLLELLVDGLMSRPIDAVNLWVGDLTQDPDTSHVRRIVKWASATLVLVVVAFVLKQTVLLQSLHAENAQLAVAIDGLCHDIWGPDKVCQETFLQKEIAVLLRRDTLASSQSAALLPTLTDVANAMTADLQLTSFRYDQKRAELVFSVKAKTFLQLESVKDALTAQGHQVNMSASQKDDAIEGNIKMFIAGLAQ